MAGVDVIRARRSRDRRAEEQRDEARARAVAHDLHVQPRRRAAPARASRRRACAAWRAAAPSAAPRGCLCRRRRRRASDEPAVGQRQDVVEVAADGVRRPRRRRTRRVAGALCMPLGSIASWMSRAISRSPLSDSRSATSIRISRLSATNAERAATACRPPSAGSGTADERKRSELDRSEAAEQHDQPEQRRQRATRRRATRRAGDSRIVKAMNTSRSLLRPARGTTAAARARRCRRARVKKR